MSEEEQDDEEEEEESGVFGYSSGVESALVQTDSREARQLQLAETEEVTSFGEFLLLWVLRLFLEDFLGGSVQWKLSEAFGLLETGLVWENASAGVRFLEM